MTQDQDARSSDDRIAALENQVRRLESLLAGGAGSQDQQAPAAYDRRSLLRRGGAALAAGAAGAMVLPQLTGSAAAADGSNLQLGITNPNTEGTPTTLDNPNNVATVSGGPSGFTGGNPTLALSNSGLPRTVNLAPNGQPQQLVSVGSPPLRLAPNAGGPDPLSTKMGDVFVQAKNPATGMPTQLLFTHDSGTDVNNQAIIGSVYTDYLANLFVPVKQDSSARAYHQILPKGGIGRINFTPFLSPNGFLIAAVGVLQVNKVQGGNGYLTLFPEGMGRPSISAITWLYPNDRLSTLAIAIPGNGNIVDVYASLGAEVFFDVVGLLVPSPLSVADAHLSPGVTGSARAEKLRQQHTARF